MRSCASSEQRYFPVPRQGNVLYTARMGLDQLAKRLRTARTKLGLSQQGLADRAELSRIYVAKLEAGERTPSLAVLERLGKALRVKPADLLK
jgi:ribosome-binding protein aMBF1 (putative translation factor)